MGESANVGTVARVVRILRYLAEQNGEITVSAMSRDLTLPPSTVHRLLHLLMDQGLVERGIRPQSYRIGAEFFRLGNIVSSKMTLAQLATPFLEALVAQTYETSMLCLYLPNERKLALIRTLSPPDSLTYHATLYRPVSIAWGATGLAILAFLPDEEIAKVHEETDVSPVDGKPLPDLPEFRAQLSEIRAKGYAKSTGQKVAGALGIAAPVFGPAGNVIASLSLTIADFRFDPSQEEGLSALVRKNAAELSRANGFERSAA